MLLATLAADLDLQGFLINRRVIITQMSNSGLKEYFQNSNIQVHMVRNGDKYITDAMIDNNVILGGEQIGHIIIRTDNTRVTGDGLRTALHILARLAREPSASLSDLVGGLRKWPQVNASVHLRERTTIGVDKISGLANLLDHIREQVPDLSRLECRPASTEPSYRVMLEARETSISVLASFARQISVHIQQKLGSHNHPIEILDCVNGGHLSQ